MLDDRVASERSCRFFGGWETVTDGQSFPLTKRTLSLYGRQLLSSSCRSSFVRNYSHSHHGRWTMNASRMKLSRFTLKVTAVAVTTSSYSYGVRGFTSRAAGSAATTRLTAPSSSMLSKSLHQRPRDPSSTALPMIFDRLFASLGGGGAFGATIDYDAIPYPVPELATLAKDDTVPEDFQKYKVATFAGGCFWGLELAYQRVPGVAYTAVGYTQGKETYPNYDAVCAG